MALSAKNKTGFIDDSISKPSSSADYRYKAWIRCNNMVLSRILNSLKRIAAFVVLIYCMETAQEMWLDLKERFTQSVSVAKINFIPLARANVSK